MTIDDCGNKDFEHLFTESQNKFVFPISLENISLMLYHCKFTIHMAKETSSNIK